MQRLWIRELSSCTSARAYALAPKVLQRNASFLLYKIEQHYQFIRSGADCVAERRIEVFLCAGCDGRSREEEQQPVDFVYQTNSIQY